MKKKSYKPILIFIISCILSTKVPAQEFQIGLGADIAIVGTGNDHGYIYYSKVPNTYSIKAILRYNFVANISIEGGLIYHHESHKKVAKSNRNDDWGESVFGSRVNYLVFPVALRWKIWKDRKIKPFIAGGIRVARHLNAKANPGTGFQTADPWFMFWEEGNMAPTPSLDTYKVFHLAEIGIEISVGDNSQALSIGVSNWGNMDGFLSGDGTRQSVEYESLNKRLLLPGAISIGYWF